MSGKAANAILITIDNLRADRLGGYGYHRNTSPVLDSLAQKGALFQQAISVGGYTPIAFPAILASAPPPLRREEYGDYMKDRTPVAQVLKGSGFHTAAFCSNPYLSRFYHYNTGFAVFADGTAGGSNGYNLPEELQRWEARLEKIRRLREELERQKRQEQGLPKGQTPIMEDKEQSSFADPEARMVPMKRGGYDYGYNGQVCVDEVPPGAIVRR